MRVDTNLVTSPLPAVSVALSNPANSMAPYAALRLDVGRLATGDTFAGDVRFLGVSLYKG